MNTGLKIVKENVLVEEDRREIDKHINQIIAKHKNNRYEINKLVFESVSVLTMSDKILGRSDWEKQTATD